jgi:hypothetical protein
MKWNEHPGPHAATAEEIWTYRCRRQNIWWDGDEMAAQLSNTLSDVDFYVYNEYYYCDWEDLVALLLDLFIVPHIKDHTWPVHVQPIFHYIPAPHMFKRGWDALVPHLSDDDWAVTTVAIFVEHLRLIRDTKLSDSEKQLFTIRSHDLELVAEPFSL